MKHLALALAVLLASSGCATLASPPPAGATTTADLQGDAARPASAQGWVRSELYFGVGEERGEGERPQADPISDAQWRDFLDTEVTARFPDGLTVFDAYGQWLFRGDAAPNRLRTKVLVVLHEDTPQRRADIEAIRLAWKRQTRHQSVLWSRQAVDISF
ncbi:DUF3574 domain-containing protein [Stenotrophomonas mori]|uniref:DUF3574 domain-containing protein n=1 Tax=Stenotrophomonas mori TaxID=2871096 RepID=A0ABT0SDY8_9GAMM|nr:DUF3574 domain-containing protein [Stenotrophomonas mori]MCL7713331.1 DUF3574 domain-containing protein [Stenotrophomonas mori]